MWVTKKKYEKLKADYKKVLESKEKLIKILIGLNNREIVYFMTQPPYGVFIPNEKYGEISVEITELKDKLKRAEAERDFYRQKCHSKND